MKNSVKTILNGLGVAIVVVDQNAEIYYLNAAAMTLFPDARPGKKIKKIVASKKGVQAVLDVIESRKPDQLRVTIQGVVPTSYRISIAPMEGEKGSPNAILSFEDVSHIRDAEKMREDFVANVSHELRSPLTALYGFIETLQGPARHDGEATDRFLGLMMNESERMARLIDDLLSLSKLQATERIAPTDEVSLVELIEGVVETLTGLADRDDIKIKTKFGDHTPSVAGMRDELTQVFQNLIENAIKYSGSGSKVKISFCKAKQTKKNICICIEDQGEGIEPKHIPRLTERFYRVDKGRSRLKGGTGLGLAIVKHILIRHRGWMEITSEVGTGSTFSVYLPRLKSDE